VWQVYLGAISSVHGEPHLVAGLSEDPFDGSPPTDDGVTHYRELRGPIWRSAANVGNRTLERAGTSPDLVIYASQNDSNSTRSLAELSSSLGLPGADMVHVSGHECGNLAPALQLARDALESGCRRTVLLLLADHALEGRRLMDNGLSVFSDGAAACMVTKEPPRGPHVRVLEVVVARCHPGQVGPVAGGGIVTTTRLAAEALRACEEATGMARTDFQHVMFSNYRQASQRFLTAAMQMPPESLLLHDVSDVGHCFSADIVVNLDWCLSNGSFDGRGAVLACVMGPWSWGVIAFEYGEEEQAGPGSTVAVGLAAGRDARMPI
jgi:3-oxoacyl-[acyl-carrier-protein] synthase-3